MAVVLYHAPISLFSQMARLGLAEKGAEYVGRPIDIVRHSEHLEPWFARLNPEMVVPVLVHDDAIVTGTARILAHLDACFDGPPLTPEDEGEAAGCAAWVRRGTSFPVGALLYGRFFPWPLRPLILGAYALRGRRVAALAARHPDLRRAALAKEVQIERFVSDARDPARLRAAERGLEHELDALQAVLETRPFVAGHAYSLADVVWTVFMARVEMMERDALIAARPAVAAWYGRMKQRSSFVQADLWPRWRGLHPARVALWARVGLVALAAIACAAWLGRRAMTGRR